ncbi:MAG: DNA polymerase III subunit alpha [bacterium]|nr:DNA polymerase III subunit alpha [bacterium]
MTGFVHLRVHTPFSLLEGAVKIPQLVELCVANGMPAMAITDTGNMFGALEFASACAANGIQPIIGTLLAIRHDEEERLRDPDHAERLVLLARDNEGYANLLDLMSEACLTTGSGDLPSLLLDDLAGRCDGLICLTGGASGPLGQLVRSGAMEQAHLHLERLRDLFGECLYVEIQRHGLEAEDASETGMLDLAYELDLPLVATNDVMFADETMHQAHDVLMCIAGGATIDRPDRRRVSPDHGFASPEAMAARFEDLPEAIANTLTIARRCSATSPVRPPILPPFPVAGEWSEDDELRRQAREGLDQRLRRLPDTLDTGPYRERLEFELDVIINMGFAGYFLIVAEFIQWAKGQDIPVGPGRGSGASSVVAWSLTITDLDPIQFGLLFERFLNPDRVSMPDFDIDFCQDRRDEVIAHVQERYGADRVAQIITFGTLQARAVVRDVGRVLQLPYHRVDGLAKLIPHNPAHPVSLQQAIDDEPALKDAMMDDAVRRLIETALRLEGLYRHASTHAAGVVIGDRPLRQLIPLYRDPRSEFPVSQFHMKDVEKAGLVKFDFLGLKTLTVLKRARTLLARRGTTVDLDNLPLDDADTFAMLTRAETIGVFQLEGQGMRDALSHLKPDSIEDIIALVSLYRPGPMDNIPQFCNRKHGHEEVDYLHPSLEEVLSETYGVIIYQEQVMQIARILAGYSLAEADLLRRAMGKKIKAEMAAQRDRFVSGATSRGVDERRATEIFNLVDKFAGYGFNKSHAAAYAIVAYQTAWLKAHHPVEFLAASMTLDMGNTDKLDHFRQELVRLDIPLLPPDINRSDVSFTVEEIGGGRAAVRYALAALRNVGEGAMKALVAERDANGPFSGLFEFASRLDTRVVKKRQLEMLACAGAFDCIDDNRARVVANINRLVQFNASIVAERESKQQNLFGDDGDARDPELVDALAWTPADALKAEAEAIGFYLSAHPLEAYDGELTRLGVLTHADALDVAREHDTGPFRLAGVPVARRERTSARGNRYAFLELSDRSGHYEIVVFSDTLDACAGKLDGPGPFFLEVDGRVDGENVRFSARRIVRLDEMVSKSLKAFVLHIDAGESVVALQQVLDNAEPGQGRITLSYAALSGKVVDIVLPRRFSLSPGLKAQIEALPGLRSVEAA